MSRITVTINKVRFTVDYLNDITGERRVSIEAASGWEDTGGGWDSIWKDIESLQHTASGIAGETVTIAVTLPGSPGLKVKYSRSSDNVDSDPTIPKYTTETL